MYAFAQATGQDCASAMHASNPVAAEVPNLSGLGSGTVTMPLASIQAATDLKPGTTIDTERGAVKRAGGELPESDPNTYRHIFDHPVKVTKKARTLRSMVATEPNEGRVSGCFVTLAQRTSGLVVYDSTLYW
jgi:hypothetical protein